MTFPPQDAFEVATALAAALEAAQIPYAVGGAIAYGVWGDPRGTNLSAEATVVFKLLFYRAKDLVDIEKLVAVQGEDLDRAYIRGWMVDMMGNDDERVDEWDDIVARYPL